MFAILVSVIAVFVPNSGTVKLARERERESVCVRESNLVIMALLPLIHISNYPVPECGHATTKLLQSWYLLFSGDNNLCRAFEAVEGDGVF